MITASYALREDYWERFEIEQADIEFIYNFLLEHETPLTTEELVSALVTERINKEKLTLERQRIAGGDRYLPKDTYTLNQKLAFPALGWQSGQVIAVRSGNNPDLGSFGVIRVHFDSGEEREFATGLEDHSLNTPAIGAIEGDDLDAEAVVKNHGADLALTLEEVLGSDPDFVRVAARVGSPGRYWWQLTWGISTWRKLSWICRGAGRYLPLIWSSRSICLRM